MTSLEKLRAFLDEVTKSEKKTDTSQEVEIKNDYDENDDDNDDMIVIEKKNIEDEEENVETENKCGKYKDSEMGFISDQEFADSLLKSVEALIDKKLNSFADSQKAELKVISDTYSEVSEAIGTNFDYSGMSRNELYKFGYETISGKKLADDMDAVTAFKLVKASVNKSEKFADSQSTSEKSSTISEMLKQF